GLRGDRRGLVGRVADAEHGPRVAGQVVEAAGGGDPEVHGRRDAGGEPGDLAGRGIVAADPPAAEVGEEVRVHVGGGGLAGRRVVEGAARDRAAGGGPAAAPA